jgi:hypothetical protein
MDEGIPKSTCLDKVIFTFFGIASLLGWNALLTELDFFNYFLSDINPFKSFSFMNYVLNISFQFLLLYKKNIFSLFTELMIGIIGSIIFLIIIPMCTMVLGINTLGNKIVTSLLIVLMGFTNACASGGFFGYAGYFPLEMIVMFTAGQGLSGIGLNILQYIVIASVNITDEEQQFVVRAWIFFAFSILILLVCLFFLFYSYKDEYCRYYLTKGNSISAIPEQDDSKLLNSLSKEDEKSNPINGDKFSVQTLDNEKENQNEINEAKVVPNFSYVFKKIWDLDLIACYGYIITFALFPNASIVQNIFSIGEYNSVTIIAIYNAFDTLGRYLVNFMKPTKKLNGAILFGRSVLLFTIIFNYYCQERLGTSLTITSILIIIYVALLGMTNGIGAAMTFGLASKNAEDQIKEQVGNTIGFFSILGIFLGAVFAFGTGAIIEGIKVNKDNY